jgi:hypothetical protein
MLERGASQRTIVHTEDERAGPHPRKRAELGIVAVDDERSLCRKPAHGLTPACCDVLELSVTVELVAEEIAQADGLWPDPRDDLGQRALVDLEETELGIARVEQRGRDARDEIPAVIAAVVVFPFVAEITADPSGRRAARRSIAPGSSFHRSFPGTVVPPPAPARRDSLPATRATAISAASGIGKRKTGGRLPKGR